MLQASDHFRAVIRWGRTSVLLAALLSVPAMADAQGPPYAFETIRVPNAQATEPYGINNSGVIVGTYTDAAGIHHAFKLEGGVYTTIDYPGATHSWGLGINNLGHVVGSFSTNGVNGPWHSFLLADGVYEQFDYPGWESDARGINDAGDIAGVYNESGILPTHGFTRIDGQYATLDYPGSYYTWLWGINNAGKISGSYITQSDPQYISRGFIYDGTTFSKVEYPGALNTSVIGINNWDDVVGSHRQINGTHGFVFSQGKFRSFDAPGATTTRPLGINDAREIVGSYVSSTCPRGCGFIARPQTGLPRCDQSFHMTYTPGTLNLHFTVASTIATTWESWVVVNNVPYRLWSLALPAVPKTGPFTVPISLAPAGRVVGLSGMSIPGTGMICADYNSVHTGGTP